MAALDIYYNNWPKITATFMREVKALTKVMKGDYKALLSYKMCIFNNKIKRRDLCRLN